jgi:hypothetical protein
MAPKTRSADSPPDTPLDSSDPSSKKSSLALALDTLALVLEQMALINARLDAQTANTAGTVATLVGDTPVAQRRRDAPREPSHHELPVEQLPAPPQYPPAGYALPHLGPLFAEAPPHHVSTSRGHPHPYGLPTATTNHSPSPGGPPPTRRGGHTTRGGRRPTIDPVVIGRAAHEATGSGKDALNRSMKMSVPIMGPTTDFKQWKRNFLNFLSVKATYLIPQLAIRDSGVWLDEQAQHYTYTLLLHAASANQRDDQAMKCISPSRLHCAAAAWDIMCERLDCRSFARSLSLMDNLMVKQRHGQSLSDYVHYMRQAFDDYNEICQMVDGSAAIHPHKLLMLRGISSTGAYGQAKQCVINAFDTSYLLSTYEVMTIVLHLAHNMDDDAAPGATAPYAPPPHISAFVASGHGSHSGRGHPPRGPRGDRGLPNKCSACGSLDHILSSCTAPDDALLRWTLAKRKMIIQKYGATGGSHSAHAALLSDVPADASASLPTLEECTDEYDDTEVSVPFNRVAFSSSLTPGRNLSIPPHRHHIAITPTPYCSPSPSSAPFSSPSLRRNGCPIVRLPPTLVTYSCGPEHRKAKEDIFEHPHVPDLSTGPPHTHAGTSPTAVALLSARKCVEPKS